MTESITELPPLEERPLVTFALFAYNQEKYIREAVEGAFAQIYEPLEIILSDDCSTDRTFEIMQEMVSGYEGPHRIVLNKNPKNLGIQGLGEHVNKILGMSTGELIVLAAGDDVSLANRVSVFVEIWLKKGKPSGSLHSAVEVLSINKNLFGSVIHGNPNIGDQTLIECIRKGATGLLGCSHAITPDIYHKFGPLQKGVFFEDRCLAFRSFLSGTIIYCPEVLVKYRIHDENISGVNIFSDELRWNRWVDGVVMCYKSFYSDYCFLHSASGADKLILAELNAAIIRAERSREIKSPNFVRKIKAIYNYTYYSKLPDRVVFSLKVFGLENSFLQRSLSFVWRLLK